MKYEINYGLFHIARIIISLYIIYIIYIYKYIFFYIKFRDCFKMDILADSKLSAFISVCDLLYFRNCCFLYTITAITIRSNARNTPYFLSELRCNGTEQRLADCSAGTSCSSYNRDAAVACHIITGMLVQNTVVWHFCFISLCSAEFCFCFNSYWNVQLSTTSANPKLFMA